MLNMLKKEANVTYTENGAITYASSMDHCLDLFGTIGGMRNAEENEMVKRFVRAYTENPDLAMKILFFARDVRGGLGERKVFRTILRSLADYHPDSVLKNLDQIPEYGRYDDVLALLGTSCEEAAVAYLKEQFEADLARLEEGDEAASGISLLGKWLPSVNTSKKETVYMGRKLARAFGLTEKEYRKKLSALRRQISIIENFLRERDYSFDYEKQPGGAMLKYYQAFHRNDGERYREYLNRVYNNEAVMHTVTLMPYEIIRPLYNNISEKKNDETLDVTWNAMEDFTTDENAIVVVDGSGSMYAYHDPMPITVAHSLGLYFAERNKGAFANHFITFSNRPQLVEIKGKTLADKIRYMSTFDEVASTNIQGVFDLILDTAVKNNAGQEELPEKIYIISDMEFNRCARNCDVTNFEAAKRKYLKAGYRLPTVVFWNVASRKMQLPVTKNEQGVMLVSGCSPRLFSQVVTKDAGPYDHMMEILGADRYANIVA